MTSVNILDPGGNVFRTKRGTASYIYDCDLKVSVTAVVDSSGDAVLCCYYDVYGDPEILKDEGFYNEIYFTGAIYDESTGLYFLHSRYYDASSGRFTSMDSVRGEMKDPLSYNLYGYCNGNPVRFTDEEGHLPTIVVGALIGAGIEAGSMLLEYFLSGEPFTLNEFLINTASGALQGALVASGAGLLESTVWSFGIGFVRNVEMQLSSGKELSQTHLGEAIRDGLADALVNVVAEGIVRVSNYGSLSERGTGIQGPGPEAVHKTEDNAGKAGVKETNKSKSNPKVGGHSQGTGSNKNNSPKGNKTATCNSITNSTKTAQKPKDEIINSTSTTKTWKAENQGVNTYKGIQRDVALSHSGVLVTQRGLGTGIAIGLMTTHTPMSTNYSRSLTGGRKNTYDMVW